MNVMKIKGTATRAPKPAMRPFMWGIVSSNLSEIYPPAMDAGRPPPIIVTACVIEIFEISFGHLCSKKLAESNPREYPAQNLKKLASKSKTKVWLEAKVFIFALRLIL